jgi:hypothetical protein
MEPCGSPPVQDIFGYRIDRLSLRRNQDGAPRTTIQTRRLGGAEGGSFSAVVEELVEVGFMEKYAPTIETTLTTVN